MNKHASWKQANPVAQWWSILAWLENERSLLDDGLRNAHQFAASTKQALDDIQDLKPFLKNPEKWNETEQV